MKNNDQLIKRNGFTLVELLIVIVLIGILASFGYNTFSSSQKRAKDAQKKNDIKQYQIALENFASGNNSLYPAYSDVNGVDPSSSAKLCGQLATTYMSSCPVNGNIYKYQSDTINTNGSATALNWVLWVKEESVDSYWVVCSNGKAGEIISGNFAVPVSGACPL